MQNDRNRILLEYIGLVRQTVHTRRLKKKTISKYGISNLYTFHD